MRTIVICDAVSASRTEERVFTLKGVRQYLVAESFPLRAQLCVFLLLSSPRKGRYAGRVLVVNERNERVIRYKNFFAEFGKDNELLPGYVNIANCMFPEAGRYRFEIHLTAQDGGEALKGEHPFTVLAQEE